MRFNETATEHMANECLSDFCSSIKCDAVAQTLEVVHFFIGEEDSIGSDIDVNHIGSSAVELEIYTDDFDCVSALEWCCNPGIIRSWMVA